MFGQMPDGSDVTRHHIACGALQAWILSYGAVLQDLRLDGHLAPLVLGFEQFPPYLTDSPYFGAMVGRCGNRIGQGRFELDGQPYQLDLNMGAHHLHGGSLGIGKRNWTVESTRSHCVTLRLDLADGEMGYPGNMVLRARYTCLPGAVLDIDITAETDAPTLCNIAHHSYWNLDGHATTADHVMQLDADRMTETDQDFIATGALKDVAGTRFDFRAERPLTGQKFIDDNLCLSDARQPLRRVGHVRSRRSNLTMELRTTEPGLQVYDGYKIDIAAPGLDGRRYGPNAGVALEPQVWPDAINHEGFPSAVLRPGETYHQQTQFAFTKG